MEMKFYSEGEIPSGGRMKRVFRDGRRAGNERAGSGPGSSVLDVDFYLPPAFPSGFGHVDGQDAVPVSGLGFFRLDRSG